jgi:hypothetical protein
MKTALEVAGWVGVGAFMFCLGVMVALLAAAPEALHSTWMG